MLVTQSCPTLCDPMDCSLPGSSVLGILQTRKLEWVVYLFSRRFSQPRNQTRVSCIAGGVFTSWATREPKELPGRVHFKSLLSLSFLGTTGVTFFFGYYRSHFLYLQKVINNKDLKRLRRLSTQSTQHAGRCDNKVGCFPLHWGFSFLLC